MNYCLTSVSFTNAAGKHLGFKACGEPVVSFAQVGAMRCGHCAKHAEEARQYAERQGQANIARLQMRSGAV